MDRWSDLDGLPGVADAVERARSAIAAVRRHPANRQGWARTAAAAGIRAARASAMLDGGSAVLVPGPDASTVAPDPVAPPSRAAGMPTEDLAAELPGTVSDPILAGAVRVSAAIGALTATWQRAPLQVLARLHMLAAADLAPADRLGRPRPDAQVARRLAGLAQVVTQRPWSGPVLVAVVHGELLALRAFGSADGVVARAAARLTMVASGLDPQALTVPEVGHLRAGPEYRSAAAGYASGDGAGVAGWVEHVCRALQAGAREAQSIASAAGS
jgi:hypothetical protein